MASFAGIYLAKFGRINMAKNPVVAVLDIGSSTISVLIAERGTNDIYKIHGQSEVEYSGFLDEDFLRESELVDTIGHAINQAQNQAGMKISSMFVGVPGAFVSLFSREVELNFSGNKIVVAEDIEEIYKRGAQNINANEYKIIHRAPIHYGLSHGRLVLNPLGKKTEFIQGKVSYCFAKTSFVNKIMEILRYYKITKVDFISQSYAQGLFLTTPEERDDAVVLVDVGYITTNVMLISGEGLIFLKSFALGGGNITADISEFFNVPFDVAEKFKRKIVLSFYMNENDEYALEDKGTTYKLKANNLHETARYHISEIVKLVNACLDSCKEEFLRTSRIYVTGGGFLYMRGAKEYFGKEIGVTTMQASMANPEYSQPSKTSTYAVLEMALRDAKSKESFLKKIFG